MVEMFKRQRPRWILEEIRNETEEPGVGAFALSIDAIHFPHFRYREAKALARLLDEQSGGEVRLRDQSVQVLPCAGGLIVRSVADLTLTADEARQLAADLRAGCTSAG